MSALLPPLTTPRATEAPVRPAADRRAPGGVGGPRRTDPLRAALLLVVATTAVVAAGEIGLTLVPGIPRPEVFIAFPCVGMLCVGMGALLWSRRPSNRVGRLLVVQGLFILGAAAGNITDPHTTLLGGVLAEAPIGAMFALVLAFPGGDLRPRFSRTLVIAGYLVTIGLQVPQVLLGSTAQGAWLAVSGHEVWGERIDRAQTWSGAVVLTLGLVAAVDAVRRARDARQRRALAFVFGYGIVAIALFPLSANLIGPGLDWDVFDLFAFQQGLLAGVPLVFAFAVVFGGFARTLEVEELGRTLAAGGPGVTPQAAIAHALGDSSVEVLYRLDHAERTDHTEGAGAEHVDIAGAPRRLPDPGSPRQAHALGGSAGGAVIVYDARIVDRPLVEEAGRVLALAIERDRLTAELAASRRLLLEAGRQVASAADEARRQLARDLHDTVQNRLVLAALEAGQLGGSADQAPRGAAVRAHLDAAITDLRHVVDGVMPPLLVEQGIGAAVAELVDRLPLPAELSVTGDVDTVPDVVASTVYFVAAEALTNVLKHARASRVEVVLGVEDDVVRLVVEDDGCGIGERRGGGLTGLAGRVTSIGGWLDVHACDGAGTRLVLEVPCAS